MVRRLLARAAGQVASGIDQLFNEAVIGRSDPALTHEERLAGLAEVERFYDRPELAASLFPQQNAIAPETRRLRGMSDGGELLELRWPSEFEPLADGDFRARYLAVEENRTAHARWYRHPGARPCAVLLHGYASGALALEARVWPVDALYRGGLDVVLTVLPFHGPRRDPRRGLRPPAFPVAGDVRLGIEGMRQLVGDHRALFDYLERAGTSALGVMGSSFGGYSAALLATLEARLRFGALLVPLAQLEPRSWSEPPLLGSVEVEHERSALRRAQRVVSPFARASLLPADRCVVIAGELDRVTGIAHARVLADHMHAPLYSFAGGHLLQFGRGQAFAHVYAMLQRAGLWAG